MRGSVETLLAKAKSHGSSATMLKASLKAAARASTALNCEFSKQLKHFLDLIYSVTCLI
jgi:hypothetical protein